MTPQPHSRRMSPSFRSSVARGHTIHAQRIITAISQHPVVADEMEFTNHTQQRQQQQQHHQKQPIPRVRPPTPTLAHRPPTARNPVTVSNPTHGSLPTTAIQPVPHRLITPSHQSNTRSSSSSPNIVTDSRQPTPPVLLNVQCDENPIIRNTHADASTSPLFPLEKSLMPASMLLTTADIGTDRKQSHDSDENEDDEDLLLMRLGRNKMFRSRGYLEDEIQESITAMKEDRMSNISPSPFMVMVQDNEQQQQHASNDNEASVPHMTVAPTINAWALPTTKLIMHQQSIADTDDADDADDEESVTRSLFIHEYPCDITSYLCKSELDNKVHILLLLQ